MTPQPDAEEEYIKIIYTLFRESPHLLIEADKNGWLPLHHAAASNNIVATTALLNIANTMPRPPTYSEQQTQQHVYESLETVKKEEKTALQLARENKADEVATCLDIALRMELLKRAENSRTHPTKEILLQLAAQVIFDGIKLGSLWRIELALTYAELDKLPVINDRNVFVENLSMQIILRIHYIPNS